MTTGPPNWWKGERGEWWVVGQGILIAALVLAPAHRPWLSMPRTPNQMLGAVLLTLGLALAGWAIVALGPNLTPLPAPKGRAVLVESGPYALVRHPIYGGLVLIGVGWALLRAGLLHLPLAYALAFYLNMKASREERFMRARFPEYGVYLRRTPRRLIPWVV